MLELNRPPGLHANQVHSPLLADPRLRRFEAVHGIFSRTKHREAVNEPGGEALESALRQATDWLTGRIHSLGLFLTRRCNSRCAYCCLDVGTDSADKLTLVEIRGLLDQASTLGVRSLVIPGEGENR